MKLSPIFAAAIALVLAFLTHTHGQVTDASAPLHLLQPEYETPYGVPDPKEVTAVLDRVYSYLDDVTPAQLVNKETGEEITDLSKIPEAKNLALKQGDYRLTSYEWGVTYAGMLAAAKATGDRKYADYAFDRLGFLAEIRPGLEEFEKLHPDATNPIEIVMHPDTLDHSGAMCAAMIKAKQAGLDADVDPLIENYIDFISNKELRLDDGTLARNRPQPHSLWLDDLFMSVPALARMGSYTGEQKYYDDAVRQVKQFSDRMFNHDKGLFMHGWIERMKEHPEFYWARANGWAVMTMIELLDVLPEDHPGRPEVLGLLQEHIKGLASYQSPQGFWHQLLDRNDSYLETSATAIYAYAIARAINKGYADPKAYGPMVALAWNAVASKVNDKGQVEGTCVGTGMGFDPAYYYYRPVSAYAAHGYGPVLLAGSEMIELVRNAHPAVNDRAVHFYDEEVKANQPIFHVGE